MTTRAIDARGRAGLVSALLGGAALGALAALPGGALLSAAAPDAPAQTAVRQFLPHLVANGYTATVPLDAWTAAEAVRPHGMFSWGESIVEVQNLSSTAVRADLTLVSLAGYSSVRAERSLAAMGAGDIVLANLTAITHSDYAGVISAPGPIGVLARSRWETGAASVYEAPQASRVLLLPLFAINVLSHTSILQFTNTDAAADTEIEVAVTDGSGQAHAWTLGLRRGQSSRLDASYLAEFRDLPPNAAGGFMGTARITSDRAVAVMAYGDEGEGRGTSAVAVRPESAASLFQYIPLVRANIGGDSLIAVANAAGHAVDVTITFAGASSSPAGAGRTYTHQFAIAARQQANVDLDPRRSRGNVPPPNLPRGTQAGRGFFGSATVSASGPVLVSVLEQDIRYDEAGRQNVLTSAAYNAYGLNDLGRAFAVPRALFDRRGYTTNIVLMNPGGNPVSATIEWAASGGPKQSAPVAVAPGQIGAVALSVPGGNATGTAVIRADGPIAALVYDVASNEDLTAYWPVRLPDGIVPSPTATTGGPTTIVPPTPGSPTATSVPPTAPVTLTAPPTTPPGPGTPTGVPTGVSPTATARDRVPAYLPFALRPQRR